MPDEPTGTEPGTTQPAAEPAKPTPAPAPVTSEETSQTVPYGRFKEVNDSLKAMREEMATFKADQEAVRQAKLEADGKTKQLLEESRATVAKLQPIADQFEADQKARRETATSKLPEDQREIYGDMEIGKLEAHVALLEKQNSAGMTAGNHPGGAQVVPEKPWSDMTREERKAHSRKVIEASQT